MQSPFSMEGISHCGPAAAAFLLPLVAAGLVGMAGCARPPAPRTPLVLSVANHLGRTIAEIRRKDCSEAESSLAALAESRIASGETRRFELPPSCVDLIAIDERGRVVGEQRGLRMLPGATWVLRP